jgi:hypothetical protein
MTENSAVIKKIRQGSAIAVGIMALVQVAGENSRDHGFHEDWPTDRWHHFQHPAERSAVRRAIAEKLALVHEEVSEALGEIRSGHAPLEVYYLDKKTGTISAAQLHDEDGVPQLKPEGFLVELADAMIRIADLAYLAGDKDGTQLASALQTKAVYNATREHKHGREF